MTVDGFVWEGRSVWLDAQGHIRPPGAGEPWTQAGASRGVAHKQSCNGSFESGDGLGMHENDGGARREGACKRNSMVSNAWRRPGVRRRAQGIGYQQWAGWG